ncbi:hypothetical protein FQN49_007316 [Arthroderma sp. PD_2]|nr:hypothetical protein FQN49_007316 [Arthroderma sp. PD_2]
MDAYIQMQPRPASSIYSRETFPEDRQNRQSMPSASPYQHEKDVDAAGLNMSTHTVDGLVHPAMRTQTHTQPSSAVTSISGLLRQLAPSGGSRLREEGVEEVAKEEDTGEKTGKRCRWGFFWVAFAVLAVTLVTILALCICISAGAFNQPARPVSSAASASSVDGSVSVTVRPPASSLPTETEASTSTSTGEPREKLSGLVPYLTFVGGRTSTATSTVMPTTAET